MRNRTVLSAVLALLVAACSGAYDRELLGEPAPIAVSEAPGPGGDTAEPDSYDVETDAPYEPDGLPSAPPDYEMFGELDAYGTWYETPDYGLVWRPTVVMGWQPFHHGHWMWTSYGWMWASYEPFGWAAYHYGYWWFDPILGWVWVPDYEWWPCPVTWFYTDYYIGWAPLPPPGWTWDDPWDDQGRYRDGWTVVDAGKFKEVDIGESRVTPTRFKADYRSGTAVRRAPDLGAIEKATRQSFKEANIRIDSRRVGDREVRKVVLPSREQQVVDRFPMVVPSQPMPIQTVAPVEGGGTNGGTPSSGRGAKSRDASTPPAKGTTPAKVKESRRDSKGSSKSTPKAKGESDKDGDGGKSKKGDSKDDGGNGGKAKGGDSRDDDKGGAGKAKGGRR